MRKHVFFVFNFFSYEKVQIPEEEEGVHKDLNSFIFVCVCFEDLWREMGFLYGCY